MCHNRRSRVIGLKRVRMGGIMRSHVAALRWGLVGILILLSLVGCVESGGSDETGSDASTLLAKAVRAMEANPRFSVTIGSVDPGGEVSRWESGPELEFVLPDRFSFFQKDAYDIYPFLLTIGGGTYVSENGIRWEEIWGSGPPWFLQLKPYELLHHAKAPVDGGRGEIDGKRYRIIEGEVDLRAWAQDSAYEPMLSFYLDSPVPLRAPDSALLKGLGYRPVIEVGSVSKWLSARVFIDVNHGDGPSGFYAEVNGLEELTPEIEAELGGILESCGMEAVNWHDVRVNVQGGAASLAYFANERANLRVRAYVDEESSLPRRVWFDWSQTVPEGVEELSRVMDITYDESITIERPGAVLHSREVEALFGMVQDQARELQQVLDAFKEANGRYPETLDPESVREAMEAASLTWPENPYTGGPMTEKEGVPGDYRYEPWAEGNDYELRVFDYYDWFTYHAVEPEDTMVLVRPSPPIPPQPD